MSETPDAVVSEHQKPPLLKRHSQLALTRMPKKRKSLINIHLKALKDFNIVRTLGAGSYGRVVLVQDRYEGKFYAMKVLEKAKVVRKNQVEHTRNELSLLASLSFEFIVNMRSYFKDNSNIFFILDFAIGGEMWGHMRKHPHMKEESAMFYAAQMLLALEYLQQRDIVHRDLKTENVLIDASGYLKLADFGFAKRVPSRTWTVCGTSEYMAPEIIREGRRHRAGMGLGEGYTKAVDWWAYGILVYEMANHRPPFRHKDKMELYELITACVVVYPSAFTPPFVDLLQHLLVPDPEARFDAALIKAHEWFAPMCWGSLLARSIPPPYVPVVAHEGDSGHFERFPEEEFKCATEEEYPEHFGAF